MPDDLTVEQVFGSREGAENYLNSPSTEYLSVPNPEAPSLNQTVTLNQMMELAPVNLNESWGEGTGEEAPKGIIKDTPTKQGETTGKSTEEFPTVKMPKTKSEIDRLAEERKARVDMEQNLLLLGVDQKTINRWKIKGEIGDFEALDRDISKLAGDWSRLAYEGVTALTHDDMPSSAVLRGEKGAFYEKHLPEFMQSPALRQAVTYNAIKRITDMDYKGSEKEIADLLESDKETVKAHLVHEGERLFRGYSTTGKIATSLLELPSYLLSFALTRGAGTAAKKATQKGVMRMLKGSMKTALPKALKKMGVSTAGEVAAVGTQTALAQNLVVKETIQRNLDSRIQWTKNQGVKLLKEPTETPVTNYLKSLASTAVTFGSERATQFLTPAFKKTMEKAFKMQFPNKQAKDLWMKETWDGFVSEIGEEYLEKIVKGMTGLESLGLEDNASFYDKLAASLGTAEDLLVTSATLAPLAGAGRYSEHRRNQGMKAVSEVKELSEETLKGYHQEVKAEKEAEQAKVKENLGEDIPEGELVEEDIPEGELVEEKPVVTETEAKPAEKKAETKDVKEIVEKDIDDFIKQGRVNELNTKVDKHLSSIESLETRIEEKLKKGHKVDGLLKQLEANRDQVNSLDAQISDINKGERTPAGRIRSTVGKAMQAFDSIKKIQLEVKKAINTSDLHAEDKGKFIDTIISVQSKKQLKAKLPNILDRIEKLEEHRAKERVTKKIKLKLKQLKAKKDASGKLKGKTDANAEIVIKKYRDAFDLSREQVETKIAKLQTELDSTSDFEDQIRIASDIAILDAAGNVKHRTSAELEDVLKRITYVAKEGKDRQQAELETARAAREDKRKTVIKDIGRDRTVEEKDEGVIKSLIQKVRRSGGSLQGFSDILDILSRKSKNQSYESETSGKLSTTEATRQELDLRTKWVQNIHSTTMDAYGLKSMKQSRKKIDENSIKKNLGTHTDLSGQEVNLKLSKDQMIALTAYMKRPDLKEHITTEEMGGVVTGNTTIKGMSPSMLDVIEDEMSPEDYKMADNLVEYFNEIYPVVNKQFRKDRFVDLTREESYVPLRRLSSKGNLGQELFEDKKHRSAIMANSLKERAVKAVAPIQLSGATELMHSHAVDMAHYVAFSDILKDLNYVFKDAEVRQDINELFGEKMVKHIDSFVDDFTSGFVGGHKGNVRSIDKLRRNFVVASISAKPIMVAKQMASVFTALEYVNPVQFTKGIADFAANPKKSWKELTELSPFFANRGEYMERDVVEAFQSPQFRTWSKTKKFADYLTFFTKLGDKGAIAVGGWAVYKTGLEKHGNKDKAIRDFEKFLKETQQSPFTEDLSSLQRGGTMAKLLTTYMTSPIQYFRKEAGAVRGMVQGRMPLNKVLNRIFIYHFVLPTVFQWISDGFSTDDDELDVLAKTAMLGSTNGVPVGGDVLERILSEIMIEAGGAEVPTYRLTDFSPLGEALRDVENSLKKIDFNDIILEDVFEAVKQLSDAPLEGATGLPVGRAMGTGDLIESLSDEEYRKALMIFLGYPKSVIEKAPKKKKKKKKRKSNL